ncbi:hypothetical protein ACOJQI_11435 [Bacillus salacetis]|uniref:hypothetical protein n=1 Tax=Bacillus salacetis TaxID=2315464 RepID=UPI003BA061A4
MNSSPNEMRIIVPKGCDNAPRKRIVINFTIALLKRQNEVIMEYADESIIWYQLKDKIKLDGQSSLFESLQEENKNIIDYLEIYQVITHGKYASINGVISLAKGSKIDFCDVYTFSSNAKTGKVKEIKSYRL